MKPLQVVVVLVVRGLLVGTYMAVYHQDPIIPDPNRGHMVQNGVTMILFCGPGSYREVLDKVPPNGDVGTWTRGEGRCGVTVSPGTTGVPCTLVAQTKEA